MKIKLFFTIILFFAIATEGFAHKVIVFAWVEGGMIYTQSGFGSKRKAKKCPLNVLDESGKSIHKGITDDQGEYAFKIPKGIKSDLIIQLEAGTGHKGQWTLSLDELVLPTTPEDAKASADKREQIEQGPSPLKIIGGLAIIFALAGALKLFKRKKGSDD